MAFLYIMIVFAGRHKSSHHLRGRCASQRLLHEDKAMIFNIYVILAGCNMPATHLKCYQNFNLPDAKLIQNSPVLYLARYNPAFNHTLHSLQGAANWPICPSDCVPVQDTGPSALPCCVAAPAPWPKSPPACQRWIHEHM